MKLWIAGRHLGAGTSIRAGHARPRRNQLTPGSHAVAPVLLEDPGSRVRLPDCLEPCSLRRLKTRCRAIAVALRCARFNKQIRHYILNLVVVYIFPAIERSSP